MCHTSHTIILAELQSLHIYIYIIPYIPKQKFVHFQRVYILFLLVDLEKQKQNIKCCNLNFFLWIKYKREKLKLKENSKT